MKTMSLTLGRIAPLSLLLCCLACGDSDSDAATGVGAGTSAATTASTTASSSTGTTGAGGAGGGAVGRCGPGPYGRVSAEVSSYAGGAIAGARLTVDICPDEEFVTDESGFVELDMTLGAPYNPKVEADGYLPIRTGEQVIVGDFAGGGSMLPEAFVGLLPSWSTTSPTMVAVVAFAADPPPTPDPADPCTSADGVTFSVTGHPEAVVTYYAGTNVPTPDPSLQATGPIGLAEISGIPATAPGELIELVVAKPGCDIDAVSYPHTGRYILEDGVVTLGGGVMPPIDPP